MRVLLCAPDRAERTLVAAALDRRGVPTAVFDPTAFPGANLLTLGPEQPADDSAVWSMVTAADELAAVDAYYAAQLDAGLLPFGDRQSGRRFSLYNDPLGRFLHTRYAGVFAAVAGQPLRPSFCFFFTYVAGADLLAHKDRPQAEFSISLQLRHRPTPDGGGPTGWPLRFRFDDGRTVAADLGVGDAVLYHGREVTHFRDPLPAGQQSSVLVLEYVRSDFTGLLV